MWVSMRRIDPARGGAVDQPLRVKTVAGLTITDSDKTPRARATAYAVPSPLARLACPRIPAGCVVVGRRTTSATPCRPEATLVPLVTTARPRWRV